MIKSSLGWLTLVGVLLQVGALSRKQSFDQKARELVAFEQQRLSVVEKNTHGSNLQDLKELSQKIVPGR